MATGSDPVRTYFTHVAPWEKDTYINIHAFLIEGGKMVPKATRAARDLDEAVSFARWCTGMGWEVFACMSSQRSPGVAKVDKRGNVNYRALRGAANSVGLKAFWVDVDVKEGAYGSTDEAVQAIREFCATSGLPLPTILVYSGGGGFHAYWLLTRILTPDEWRPIAGKLAEACRQHDLKADHGVTVDIARILRVPGSANRKYGQPRPVTHQMFGPPVDPNSLMRTLEPYADNQSQTYFSGGGQAGLTPHDSLDPKNFIGGGPPIAPGHWLAGVIPDAFTLEEVAEGCPWIKKTLETGGKDQSEPLWFRAGHIAVFTEGEVKDFHRLSKGYGNYSPADTDAKFSRILDDKRMTDRGWPRCEQIERDGSTWCATCHHKSAKRSPLNFARKTPEPEPDPVTPPGNGAGNNPQGAGESVDKKIAAVPGYIHNPTTGVVSYEVTDRKGNVHEENILNGPIWDPKYREDEKGQFAIHFDTMLGKKHSKHVVVPNSEMRNGDSLRACLQRFGVAVHTGQEKGILDYMAAFKDLMREARDSVDRQELMGWCEDNGKPVGFIYGPYRFSPSGSAPFNQPDNMIRTQYFPTGSPDPWIKAIRMVNAEKRPEMDILVATAFAAPLMKFTGEKGVVISAFSSETAAHKTTAIKVGQAVWGSHLAINQLSDTLNSVLERVARTRVVPTYYDEMKASTDIPKFASMIYTFTGGRSKGRLSRNIELRDIATWDTLLVGVSNDSLFDYIAQHDTSTDAGVARIFEFEVVRPTQSTGQIDMGKAGELLKLLEGNYGHAGLAYVEYLGRHVHTLQGRVTSMVSRLRGRVKADGPERFWIAAAAVLMVGAEIANELKLTDFDLVAMENFIDVSISKMRSAKTVSDLDISKSAGVVSALATFVNTRRRSIIVTDALGTSARGGTSQVQILNLVDLSSTVDKFQIRYIRDPTPVMRFSQSALRTWLAEQKLSPGVFIKNMLTLYGGKTMVTSLTAGTSRTSMKERVIELDLNHPDLIDLYVP